MRLCRGAAGDYISGRKKFDQNGENRRFSTEKNKEAAPFFEKGGYDFSLLLFCLRLCLNESPSSSRLFVCVDVGKIRF